MTAPKKLTDTLDVDAVAAAARRRRFTEALPSAIDRLSRVQVEVTLSDSTRIATVPLFETLRYDRVTGLITIKPMMTYWPAAPSERDSTGRLTRGGKQ